jgi:hypothetical protein
MDVLSRMSGSPEGRRPEPRWPVALAILIVLILVTVLPHHYRPLPFSTAFVIAAIGWLSMLAVALGSNKVRWLRIEGTVLKAIALFLILVAGASLVVLIGDIVSGPTKASGLELLTSSVAIWVCNVFAFSLLYWQIDGDGPVRHREGRSGRADWLFAQAGTSESTSPARQPVFVDYLFLAFSAATAFSTTDTVPLTPKAKLLMMLEAGISMVTLVVVASRAINILGS